MTGIAFVANTNNLDLLGLKSATTGEFVNDATVAVTVKDKAGEPVTGETWPLTMTYVENSSGDYRGVISNQASFAPGQWYTAEITADGGAGRIGFWKYPFRALVRQDL